MHKNEEPDPDASLEAFADNLRDVHQAAGVPVPPATALRVPTISVRLPIDDLTDAVTDFLKDANGSQGLFRYQDMVVTINGRTGEMKQMKAHSFRTWLPKRALMLTDGRVAKKDKNGEPVLDDEGRTVWQHKKGELKLAQAETILASETLLAKLPEIKGIHPVKMPVFSTKDRDEHGHPQCRLLQPGFDVETGIYTMMQSALDFDENVSLQDAVEGLYATFRYFGWRQEPRDLAIYLSFALTVFGRGIYLGKAPMLVLNANIQESGKSILMEWLVRTVWGTAGTHPLLEDTEESLEKYLNSKALNNAPYVVFDNVDWDGHVIKSALLDEWLTQRERDLRKLGGDMGGMPTVRACTIMTGNNLKLSADLNRRSQMVDLWNPLSGADRVLPADTVVIDDRYFENEARRSESLAWLWALVREWCAAGRPERPETRKIGSFTGWSEVFPHVVWYVGKTWGNRDWNCMAESTNEEIGDKDGLEYKKLGQLAVAEYGPDEETRVMREVFEITVAQLAGVFRRNGIAPAYNPLYPEIDIESVMQTEDQKGGWKFIRPKDLPQNKELAALEGFDEDVERRRQAAEWMNPKTRSSFGNAVKRALNDKHSMGPDGNYYHFVQRIGVSPARYMVTRAKR